MVMTSEFQLFSSPLAIPYQWEKNNKKKTKKKRKKQSANPVHNSLGVLEVVIGGPVRLDHWDPKG